MNYARFHDPRPWAFGHEYLTVGWQTRIRRWGLFSYHFLPRNLGVMLASLPWRLPPGEALAGRAAVHDQRARRRALVHDAALLLAAAAEQRDLPDLGALASRRSARW